MTKFPQVASIPFDVSRIPTMIDPSMPKATSVSIDIFAFDDSITHYTPQGLGTCCDRGDATLGLAIAQLGAGAPKWIAIRNASDPQIPNPNKNIREVHQPSTAIDVKYQCITTAGSVVASWAVAVAERDT